MRKISEQELKEILDKHGKWLRSEDGGERADLSYADLSSANLSYADLSSANLSYANLSYADLSSANLSYAVLSYADLRFADLSYADLSSANLRFADLRFADLSYADLSYANLRSADLRFADLMVFQFQRHQAFYTLDGTLRIGCLVMPVSEWLLGFEEIGKKEDYTPQQIKAYGGFIKMCAEMMEKEGDV